MWRHTIQYFGIRAINGALGLGAIYVLTRLLNAEQYGLYALGLASINVAASILFQWLNAGIARLSSTYSNSQAVFFNEVQWLFKMTVITGLVILLLWLAFKPDKSLSTELSAIIGIAAIAMGTYNMHLQIHNAHLQPLRYGIMSTSRAAFLLAIAGIASWSGFGELRQFKAVRGVVALAFAARVCASARMPPKTRSHVQPLVSEQRIDT